jgi:hypothetical protein
MIGSVKDRTAACLRWRMAALQQHAWRDGCVQQHAC